MSFSRDAEGDGASEGERLNLEAYKALAGLYGQSDGENRLAQLLRSDVKIDPYVREALANALSPNGERYSGVKLRLAGLGAGDFVRKMRTQGKMLRVGQQALQLIAAGGTRTRAEAVIAEREGYSSEYVKKAIDYARRFKAWESEQSPDGGSQQDRIIQEQKFHASVIHKIDPKTYERRLKAVLYLIKRSQRSLDVR